MVTIGDDSGCASPRLPRKTSVRGFGLMEQNDAWNPKLDLKAGIFHLVFRERNGRGRGS